jgi:hypothetical protein
MNEPPPLPEGRWCSRCGANIPADANFCHACGASVPKSVSTPQGPTHKTMRPVKTIARVSVVILLLWIFIDVITHKPKSEHQTTPPAATATTSEAATSKHKSETVRIGEIAQLRLESNSEAIVLVASTNEAFDAFTKAAVSHDKEGVAALVLADKLWPVKGGTKVRVIDYGGFLNATKTQVRILEGVYYGRSGWVASEEVAPVSPIESATPEIRKAKPVLSASPK